MKTYEFKLETGGFIAFVAVVFAIGFIFGYSMG